MARNEHIQVSLRFRPLSEEELKEGETVIWKMTNNSISLKPKWLQVQQERKRSSKISKSYSYNHCFSSSDSNEKLYETMARRVVLSSLQGYNGTIFMYGQTGSGKTYTMMGPGHTEITQDTGVLILALHNIFSHIAEEPHKLFYFACSYLEIYNEQVFDLLTDSEPSCLGVNEDPERGFYVKGLSEFMVKSFEEAIYYIAKGEKNRRYAETAMNHHSSRSHTIFRFFVTSITVSSSSDSDFTSQSVLNFVDLAGSERASSPYETVEVPSKKTDTLLTEGKYINTSLFYLCQVIHKLSEKNTNKSDVHVPYRNSNLTKILRSSLGGNSLTSIICTATPTFSHFEMTLSTLRFGGIAKTITNKVAANIRANKNAELLQAYQRDIDNLKRELEAAQQGGKTKEEEANNTKKQLEKRLLRLTQMLFNQTRRLDCRKKQTAIGDVFWTHIAGDLSIRQNAEKCVVESKPKFSDTGKLAVDGLRNMNRELKKKDNELNSLIEYKESLMGSKNNLKNDLKKTLGICKDLSDQNTKFSKESKAISKNIETLRRKVRLLELQEGLEQLSDDKIEQLEAFYLKAIDAVKTAKLAKKYEQKLNLIRKVDENSLYLDFSRQLKSGECSFVSEENSVVLTNLFENGVENKLSPIKKGPKYQPKPLTESNCIEPQ